MTLPAPPKTAAFFDFDRTVLDGDAGILFGRELLRIQRRRLRDDRRGTLAWAVRNVAHEARAATMLSWALAVGTATTLGLVKRSQLVRTAYSKLAGASIDDLRLLASDYFDEVLADRIYPRARQEIQRHKTEGRRVVVVSTGLHLLLDCVKRHLPVDDVIAVHLVARHGRATGNVLGPLWGRDKAKAVRAYAHERDLSLPKSWAYTDHHSDLALLQTVGHPVAVNPTRRLRLAAAWRNWPIVRWEPPPASKSLSSPVR